MHKLPIESKVFWITLQNGMKVEIDYYVYHDHTHAYANYYYHKEDCVTGSAIGANAKEAIQKALDDLKFEMKEFYKESCEIIQTRVPYTGQKATIIILPQFDE